MAGGLTSCGASEPTHHSRATTTAIAKRLVPTAATVNAVSSNDRRRFFPLPMHSPKKPSYENRYTNHWKQSAAGTQLTWTL
jgi:hypothetical protein